MKKNRIIIYLLLFLYGFNMYLVNAEEVVNMQYIGERDDRIEFFVPADMPEVYYDDVTEEIVIVADGFADYYEVDIVSQSTLLAVISTQIGGYGDNIDISSLPDDNYTIIITSSNDNVYQGQFTNY